MPEYILTLIQGKGKIAFFFLLFASTKNESPKGKKKMSLWTSDRNKEELKNYKVRKVKMIKTLN